MKEQPNEGKRKSEETSVKPNFGKDKNEGSEAPPGIMEMVKSKKSRDIFKLIEVSGRVR